MSIGFWLNGNETDCYSIHHRFNSFPWYDIFGHVNKNIIKEILKKKLKKWKILPKLTHYNLKKKNTNITTHSNQIFNKLTTKIY